MCAGYEKDFEKFHNQLIENSTSERKKWNLINELRNSVKTTTTVYSLKNSFNEIITEKTKIASLLNLKFSKLGEFFESRNYTLDLPMVRQKNTFSFRFVTKFECLKTLLALGKFKPLGPSTIPSWALRDAASELAEPICFLLNEFIKTETFPAELKRADITPLFKKGDLDDPLNYRPISLTPALAKVFESLIKQQIDEYVHKNALLSKTQFGFRKKFSTTDALVYLTEKIRCNKNEKKITAAAFLDLSKAFDSINLKLMIQKLSILGFSIPAQNLITSYLSNRTQRVIINNVKSSWIEVAQGVPQGTVLGPLLFNLYVNDLSNFLSCETIQYADDTVLLSSHDEVLKCKDELEKAIEKCIQFFKLHHLKINPDKTEFIIFGSSNPHDETTLKVGDKLISSKAEIKYLGVNIDKDLKYQKQVKILLSKMAQGIKCIYALRNIIPTGYKKIILNAFVLSHVQYSSVLLATINQNLITTLGKQLNWAIKACFHRQKFDSSSDLKMNLGILPISLLFDYRAATYCHSIMNKKKPASQAQL